jgi:ubiquinone/menaquinone biosynthesis C-methylase UbiE
MIAVNDLKRTHRLTWAAGDYAAVAEQIDEAPPRDLLARAELGPGLDALDVATGTGNIALRAAAAGATVVGLDLTPELFGTARRRAERLGVTVEWIEGDAEQLPFEDQSFDAVISVFGCMFAPDHKATAMELARVLRPGGRMAVCAWTPDGNIGQFFMTVAKHMPPPPEGFQPPILWGTEDHAGELFDGTGVQLEFEHAAVEFFDESAQAFLAEYEAKLPPIVAAKAALEPDGKWQALRDELEALYESHNEADDGSYRAPGEYLVISGREAS